MYRLTFRTAFLLALLLSLPLAHGKKPPYEDPGYERQEANGELNQRPLRGRVYYPGERENQRQETPGMSLSQAIDEARRRTGGRVLSAEPYRDRRGDHYRIKVLTPAGRVQTIFIGAE